MLNLNPIKLENKELFDNYFSKFPPIISEFTFSNLYFWYAKNNKFTIYKEHLLICFEEKGKNRFYQPVGKEPESIIKDILEKHPECGFERIDEKVAGKIKNTLMIERMREMDDYVYDINELSELKGRKWANKRNFVNRLSELKPDTCTLKYSTVKSFFELQEQWCDMHKCEFDSDLRSEHFAINEALKRWKELNLFGICIRINDKIAAFAIGEKLNNDTFVEHFEKADTKYQGIYQLLLYEFAKLVPKEFKYLNREQDLGIEGLRKSKLSWNPVKMVEKFGVGSGKIV